MNNVPVAPSSYNKVTWNGIVYAPSAEDVAVALTEQYIKSQGKNAEKMKFQCAFDIENIRSKVIVSIRSHFRGLFSDDFKKDGAVDVRTSEGSKTKYQIKVTALNHTPGAFTLTLFLIYFLNKSNLITHSKAYILEKDSQEKVVLSVDFTDNENPKLFLK